MRNIFRVSLVPVVMALFFTACSVIPVDREVDGKRNGVISESSESTTLHPLGAIADDPALKAAKGTYYPTLKSASLASSVDLSGNMPPVGDQQWQGSCVGWATAYALKSYQEKEEEGWNQTLKSHQFSPAWIYNQINDGVDKGSTIYDALTLIVNKGCDTLDRFPYYYTNYTRQPDSYSFAFASRYKAISWSYLPNTVDAIKQVLANGQPVVFSIQVHPDFDNISTSNPVYDNASGTNRGLHALCIVGYDDSIRAFKFINSWGAYWGINGYGWISYDFVCSGSPVDFGAYCLMDNVNQNGLYITPKGSDGPYNDGSKLYPFRTVEKAIKKGLLCSLSNIYITKDTYTNTITITNSHFTISGGWDGSFISKSGLTVIEGYTNSSPLIFATNVENIKINGFVLQNATKGGGLKFVKVVTGIVENTVIRNCTAGTSALFGGMYLLDSSYISFNGTIQSNSGYDSGGIRMQNCGYVTISGDVSYNTAYGNGGINIKNCGYIWIPASVHGNYAYYTSGICVADCYNYPVSISGYVYSNTNISAGYAAIVVNKASSNVTINETRVYNNTPANVVRF